VNADDDQRADDLERVLDEGDLARAIKMVRRWSSAHAGIAVGEVQARNDAHRAAATGSSTDPSKFTRRDEELVQLRAAIEV
jgi:hypothetical protein